MKYPIILLFLTILFLFIIQKYFFAPRYDGTDKITKIAWEMHNIGLACRTLSGEEMKKRQLQFLNDNKTATVQDLVSAIEMKINGQDIISLLQSCNSDVCKEYAESLRSAHASGIKAIEKNFGNTSIETLMYWNLI